MFLYLCNNFLKPFKTENYLIFLKKLQRSLLPRTVAGKSQGPSGSASRSSPRPPGLAKHVAACTNRQLGVTCRLSPGDGARAPPPSPPSLTSLLLLRQGCSELWWCVLGWGELSVEDADGLHFSASLTFEYLCKKHVCIYSVLDFSNFCILRAEHL